MKRIIKESVLREIINEAIEKVLLSDDWRPQSDNGVFHLYHNTNEMGMDDIIYDGFFDPKAYHKGECPYDCVWFTRGDDYGNFAKFSFDVPESEFANRKFEWMNRSHAVCYDKISINEYNCRLVSIGGINIDVLFKHTYGKTHDFYDFIESLCMSVGGEHFGEEMIRFLLKQYNLSESEWFGDEN